jgi:hypothetical protein
MGRLREAIAEGESILKAEPDDGWTMDELATAKLDLGETLLQGDGQRAEGCREIDGGLLLWKALSARAEIPPESAKSRDRYERLWRACQRHGTS